MICVLRMNAIFSSMVQGAKCGFRQKRGPCFASCAHTENHIPVWGGKCKYRADDNNANQRVQRNDLFDVPKKTPQDKKEGKEIDRCTRQRKISPCHFVEAVATGKQG